MGRQHGTTDPMEAVVASALDKAGIRYERDDCASGLDFKVENGPYIEVKRFHSDRIGGQMSRVQNVIVIQGMEAAQWFAERMSASQ